MRGASQDGAGGEARISGSTPKPPTIMVRNATLACRRVCKGLDVLDSIVLGGDRWGLTLVSPRADGSRSDFECLYVPGISLSSLSRSETVTDRILDSVPRPQDKKVRCKSYTLVRLGRHRQSQRTAQRAAARRAHPRAHRRTGPPAVRRAREPPAACASTHGRVRPTSGLKISSPRAHLSRQRALARDTSRDSCVPTDHSRRYSSQPALATAARAVGVTPGRAAWRAPPLDRARA